MEKEKNNNFIIIVLIIVVIIMAITIGYLLVSKNSNSSSNSNNETVNTENNEQVEEDDIVAETSYTPMCNYDTSISLKTNINLSNYTNIFDYISKQKDITMTVTYPTNEIETENEAGIFYKQASYDLTENEIEEVLSELKNLKTYIINGGTSGQNITKLLIKYVRNNQEYYFMFSNDPGYSDSNDGNVYNILDNKSNIESTGDDCNYYFSQFSQTVLDIVESKK